MPTYSGAYTKNKFSEKDLGEDKNALPDFPKNPAPEKLKPSAPSSKWAVGRAEVGNSKKKKWS
jgi:hypothetical protein